MSFWVWAACGVVGKPGRRVEHVRGSQCATPAGAYVITGETVTWQPALDLNRVILVGQIVSILIALATIRAALRSRRPRV